jgi:heme-degrading monooxygenase HmoA
MEVLMPDEPILRRWSSRIRTEDEQEYVRYIQLTGLADYRRTPGNLGCQMLLRRLGDGSTEVTTLSWWTSMYSITAFAGESPEMARYYAEDDLFLLEKPERVEHHRVVSGDLPSSN